MTDDLRPQQNDEMRRIDDEERERRIAESTNVVGHGRFTQRARQVQLKDAYRRPQAPPPGGVA